MCECLQEYGAVTFLLFWISHRMAQQYHHKNYKNPSLKTPKISVFSCTFGTLYGTKTCFSTWSIWKDKMDYRPKLYWSYVSASKVDTSEMEPAIFEAGFISFLMSRSFQYVIVVTLAPIHHTQLYNISSKQNTKSLRRIPLPFLFAYIQSGHLFFNRHSTAQKKSPGFPA